MRTRALLPLLHSLLPLVAVLVVAGSGGLSRPGAQPVALTPPQELLRGIYKELVEINTTDSAGDNTRAAEAMARHLLAAGIAPGDVQVLAPAPRKGNLVARLRGSGAQKPLLLLAHLDVVEARKEDWSDGLDPFRLTERDGYYYARGTIDWRALPMAWTTNFGIRKLIHTLPRIFPPRTFPANLRASSICFVALGCLRSRRVPSSRSSRAW